MERFLARMERHLGRFTIPGITLALVVAQVAVFVLEHTNPGFVDLMVLDRDLVLRGQVWRLVTYLFIPASESPMWVLFALYWLYVMGTALEQQWGAFRYQIYWLVGMLGTTTVAMVFGIPATNEYLLMSLFLAFATLWPDYEIRLLMVIPVKVKWLALLDGIALLGLAAGESGFGKLLPAVAVANYLLFFTGTLLQRLRQGTVRVGQAQKFNEFKRAVEAEGPPTSRRCSLCGITDADRDAEFRVCTCEKCGGKPTEFCLPHARNH